MEVNCYRIQITSVTHLQESKAHFVTSLLQLRKNMPDPPSKPRETIINFLMITII